MNLRIHIKHRLHVCTASSTLPAAPALAGCHHLLHHQMLGPDMRIADMPLNSLFRILSLSLSSVVLLLTDTLYVQNKNIFCALQKRDNNNYGKNFDNGLE